MAGTLVLDGDLALADLVVNGGTVLGTGSANGMTFNGGTLSPGASPGIITSEGDFTLAVAATYFVELNNTTPGTGHDQLVVNGTVSFAGALSGTTGSPAIGSQFVIILNDGVDPVVGTFAGLAEGAALSISGMPFAITYQGGSGNDVVLIAGPVPTTTTTTTVTTTTVTTTTPTTIPTTTTATTATTTNPLSTVAPTTTLIPGGSCHRRATTRGADSPSPSSSSCSDLDCWAQHGVDGARSTTDQAKPRSGLACLASPNGCNITLRS